MIFYSALDFSNLFGIILAQSISVFSGYELNIAKKLIINCDYVLNLRETTKNFRKNLLPSCIISTDPPCPSSPSRMILVNRNWPSHWRNSLKNCKTVNRFIEKKKGKSIHTLKTHSNNWTSTIRLDVARYLSNFNSRS